jgi:ATP-dependent DNA helicase RecG
MLTDADLEHLLSNLESDLCERKKSLSERSKIRQAVCAFANDLPDHRQPGVVFVGANDDGTSAGITVSDQMLRTLADMRSDGNIIPFPTMSVEKRHLHGGDMAVITVFPSDAPPVRYNGRRWIRVGSRRGTATREEERRLTEKRRFRDVTHDLRPVATASVDDLDVELFTRTYLPACVSPEVLEENTRTVEQQLMACRMLSTVEPLTPTVTGILVCGKSPRDFIPGAYVQFLRVDGTKYDDPIKSEHSLSGPVAGLLRRLEELIEININTAVDFTSAPTEVKTPDYPIVALQQIVRNAILHRDYDTSNAPVRISWYDDRVEIQNPGGPYGNCTVENFGEPGITDYRNPYLAEGMKVLGYVQQFGRGISTTRHSMAENGNPPPEFQVQPNHVLIILRSRQ